MIKALVLTVLCGYVALVLLIYAFQRSLMYAPSREALPSPASVGVEEMKPLQHKTSDGLTLTSWYAPPSADNGKVIVLFHGNAGNIAGRAFKARFLLDEGYGVMLVGYRGFAGNAGSPDEQGLYKDARSALRYLEQQGIGVAQTVLYGESLGSAVSVQMAYEQAQDAGAQKEVRFVGVVLEAPFSSMGRVAAVHYPWLPTRYLVRDKYDSLRKIDLIGAPLYVIHGGKDRTVPQAQGRAIYESAQPPKQAHWIRDAKHTDVYDFGAEDSLIKWLNLLN